MISSQFLNLIIITKTSIFFNISSPNLSKYLLIFQQSTVCKLVKPRDPNSRLPVMTLLMFRKQTLYIFKMTRAHVVELLTLFFTLCSQNIKLRSNWKLFEFIIQLFFSGGVLRCKQKPILHFTFWKWAIVRQIYHRCVDVFHIISPEQHDSEYRATNRFPPKIS